jgi:hypothetical protein
MGLDKAVLYHPILQGRMYISTTKEPNLPSVCQVYGHMAPNGIEVWIKGRKAFLTKLKEINHELIRHGCKPTQPVYFLGCRAGIGEGSIAERYSQAFGVPTIGSTRQTWWAREGYQGSYGRQNPKKGE